MSIFICELCGNLENTALSSYWTQRALNIPKTCHQCEHGKSHGQFEYRKYDPSKDKIVDGFVESI